MKIARKALLGAIFSAIIAAKAFAQSYKMTTPIAPGVAVPDKVESSIGTLNLDYGYPDGPTVDKIYDNLDRSRALQAYLLAIPIVNQAGMRDSIRKFGPDNQTDVDLGGPGRSEDRGTDRERQHDLQLHLARHHKGPMVVEIPPKVLGAINDFWYRWVADVGITGADKGEGGKYLVLPPGYKGDIPPGYNRRAAEHLWQLAGISRVSSWTDRRSPASSRSRRTCGSIAWRRRQSAGDEVRQCLGDPRRTSSRRVTIRSGAC